MSQLRDQGVEIEECPRFLGLLVIEEVTAARKGSNGFSPTIRHNPIDGFQASLLIKLEKLDWGSMLDNKSDGHAR